MLHHLPHLLLLLVLYASCSTSARLLPELPPRVGRVSVKLINGEDLDKPEPYMASLRSSSGTHSCGGTLIHPRVVLTAAHCIQTGFKPGVDIGRLKRVGSDDFGFDSYKTLEVIVHEDYNSTSFDYDIALLVLDSASSRRQLSLATSDSCFQDTGDCAIRLLGWGATSEGGLFSDSIQQVFTRSVSHRACEDLLGASTITERMICAGEVKDGKYDSCQGDSGGPMILDGQQVGIVSFGFGCGNAQSPGVYTSVPKLRSWIDSKISSINSPSRVPVVLPSPVPVVAPFPVPVVAPSPVPVAIPLPTPTPIPTSNPALVGDNPCDCAEDGMSNGIRTFRNGCKQHLLDTGDNEFFCMTIGGESCASATPSRPFPGAAWILCN